VAREIQKTHRRQKKQRSMKGRGTREWRESPPIKGGTMRPVGLTRTGPSTEVDRKTKKKVGGKERSRELYVPSSKRG